MFSPGLVSVSFRSLTFNEIINAAKENKLYKIEWGSDVHAPKDDEKRLFEIAKVQKDAGISCCSYGTYFRLGDDDLDELYDYIKAAEILGAKVLRIWAGSKSFSEYSEDEIKEYLKLCKEAIKIAEEKDVILCFECHENTFTDCIEGVKCLMEGTDSQNLRMYWQQNHDMSVDYNIRFAKAVSPYTVNIHTFYNEGRPQLPLKDGEDVMIGYLQNFEGDKNLLLEFMPDGRVESLKAEAEALYKIIERLGS